jgi:hypothetical protein
MAEGVPIVDGAIPGMPIPGMAMPDRSIIIAFAMFRLHKGTSAGMPVLRARPG